MGGGFGGFGSCLLRIPAEATWMTLSGYATTVALSWTLASAEPIFEDTGSDVGACDEFPGWNEAQVRYETPAATSGDPLGLDPDGDGVPCDDLDGAPAHSGCNVPTARSAPPSRPRATATGWSGPTEASSPSEFRGSVPEVLAHGQRLNRPVIGAIAYGDGYLMVATDGGIFSFTNKTFYGSLGRTPPPNAIVGVAAR